MGAARESGKEADSVVLRLVVASGEPLEGAIGREGEPGAAFCGWIELMTAINSARAPADGDRPGAHAEGDPTA